MVKPDVTETTPEARRFKIFRSDIEGTDGIGYTPGCVGCNAMKAGRPAQHHSEHCRRLVEEHLRQTPVGRRRLDMADVCITEATVRAGE